MSTTCRADRIPLFERAAAVASRRSELALPVAVADAPPMELIEAPVAVAPVPDTAEARFEAEPEPRATTRGRQKLAQRASVVRRRSTNGKEFLLAQVRTPAGRRIYLGVCRSEEEGLAKCHRYMTTGRKPPKQQTGPKTGSKRKNPATGTRVTAARGPLSPRPPRNSRAYGSGAPAPSAEFLAARLEMLKAAYRRTA